MVGPMSRPNSENFLLRFCASSKASVPAFSATATVSSLDSGFGKPATFSSSAFSWFCTSAIWPFRRSFSPLRSRNAARISSSLSSRFRMAVQHSSCFLSSSCNMGMMSHTPPAATILPWPSVTVMTTRRFMKRPSLVLLLTSGSFLPSPAVVNLVGRGSVFHQEVAHGFGAPHRQTVVVTRGTHEVGVPDQLHVVIAMLAQQFGQPQEARISVREDGRIELKVDLFPLFFGLARVKP
jgi:hypothetical protein